MDRLQLQEKALLLMWKMGEVEPHTKRIPLYDYKGDHVGDMEKVFLKSTAANRKNPTTRRDKVPQIEVQPGFD